MSQSQAYCPRCGTIVQFITDGCFCRCPSCGFQYRLSEVSPQETPSRPGGVGAVLRALGIALLIVVGVIAVGIGVLFVGCAVTMGGF